MEQDKRQKKMAGHCDLGMCGSTACLFIRSAEARDIDRDYAFAEYAEARQLTAFADQHKCTADCGFQDVCRRLEVAVWNRDLSEIEYALDNGRGDYHNECDSAWDGVEDTRLVLWAGADGLAGSGTYLPWKAEKNPIKAFFFDEIEKIVLEDFNRRQKENFERLLLGLPLI